MRLIVGVSGASGVVYGVRLLEVLRNAGVESHLIVSRSAKEVLRLETRYSIDYVEALATFNHRYNDITSPISSGSFRTDGMVIAPCSMKTLAGVAHGYTDNLLLRAADVALKERRPLILVPRETPLTIIHLQNMLRVAQAGAIILPAMPSFYHNPQTVDEMINHIVGKILDALKIDHELYRRWKGSREERKEEGMVESGQES